MVLSRTPIELILLVASFILVITLPLVVGALIIKAYRYKRPLQSEEAQSYSQLPTKTNDGFFKVFFIGWAIFAPIYYIAYKAGAWYLVM